MAWGPLLRVPSGSFEQWHAHQRAANDKEPTERAGQGSDADLHRSRKRRIPVAITEVSEPDQHSEHDQERPNPRCNTRSLAYRTIWEDASPRAVLQAVMIRPARTRKSFFRA
jgi:hypothetical protein